MHALVDRLQPAALNMYLFEILRSAIRDGGGRRSLAGPPAESWLPGDVALLCRLIRMI